MIPNSNGGSEVNYEPNGGLGPQEDPSVAIKSFAVQGNAARNKFTPSDIDFEQPRAFWAKVLKEESKQYLVNTMCKGMANCRPDIKERMICLCSRVHPEFGEHIAKGLGGVTT
jgi:catalase